MMASGRESPAGKRRAMTADFWDTPMNSVPMALEVTPEGLVVPVEAPPCGATLDIPHAGIHLVCDKPAGHISPVPRLGSVLGTRHRQFLRLDPPHAVGWCDDHCSQPCEPLRGVLETLRSQGLPVQQNYEDGE